MRTSFYLSLIGVLFLFGIKNNFNETRYRSPKVCTKPISTSVTCTGSSNCTACTNCNYCGYCNNGGSCGVCSNNYYTPPTKYPKYTPSKSSYSSLKNTSTGISGTNIDNIRNYVINKKEQVKM